MDTSFVLDFINWIKDNCDDYDDLLTKTSLHRHYIRLNPIEKKMIIFISPDIFIEFSDETTFLQNARKTHLLNEAEFMGFIDKQLGVKYESLSKKYYYVVKLTTNNFLLTALKMLAMVNIKNALILLFNDPVFLSLFSIYISNSNERKKEIFKRISDTNNSELIKRYITNVDRKLLIIYINVIMFILFISIVVILFK